MNREEFGFGPKIEMKKSGYKKTSRSSKECLESYSEFEFMDHDIHSFLKC